MKTIHISGRGCLLPLSYTAGLICPYYVRRLFDRHLFSSLYYVMMGKPYTVAEIKNKITDTARQYGIQKAYLFGSYARGEAGHESDIDICIEKGKIRTLLELSGFCLDLAETLENKVDVITTAGLSGEFREQIEKDMVLIYG